MTSPSPFPPMPPATPPGSSGQLLGSSAPGQLAPAGPTPNQKISSYMDQVRSLHITIDALAQQFPAAAPDLKDAKTALANSMSKVATAMAQPEQSPSTPTF